MASYLLIESRDPFETKDVSYFYDLAQGLVREKHAVTLFLVQNGVLPARKGSKAANLTALAQAGVKVLADQFSLKERGIPSGRLVSGVEAAPLDVVVDQLEEGVKTMWH